MSTDRLFVFAFDHRDSFRRIIGSSEPGDAIVAKQHLWTAFRCAHSEQPDAGMAVLIDEQYGSAIMPAARACGAGLIVPVERSGRRELEFEYGDEHRAHIESADPDAVKVLVRWDPADTTGLNTRQGRLLADLGAWMRSAGRTLIVEFLVPEIVDSSERADAMVRVIGQIQDAGCSPELWKVEGVDDVAHAARVGAAIAATGSGASALVLGRGVGIERATAWLRCAAAVPEFVGFAIGKTLWQEPLQRALAGDIAWPEAEAAIARRYLVLIDAWTSARTS